MRLIDADALKEDIDNLRLFKKWIREEIKQHIDNAPTVEPEKVLVANVTFDEDKLKEIVQTEVIEKIKSGKLVLKTEERPQGEWIPVSERLPKQGNQSYLVTVDYGNGVVCSCQRFFFNEDIGWNDDCVIAWQELPKPYEEGEEE